jgi:hypothetical protein
MSRKRCTLASPIWWFVATAALAAPVPARAAVLVELFTALGCPFCPPADRLLSAMGSDPDLSRQVVPLAFHVDYWNSRSWHDRFSNAAWSKRQTAYVLDAQGAGVYTPHAVIAGGRQCNGADVACIHAAVEAAAARPQGAVELSVTPLGGEVEIAVKARAPASPRSLDVMVALYESGLSTEVKGGENANKTLHNDYVVRRLERAFRLDGDAAREGSITLRLDGEWVRGNLGVAAFLQDPKTHEVRGVTAIALP